MKKLKKVLAVLLISSINLVYANQGTVDSQTNRVNTEVTINHAGSQVVDIANRDILEDTDLIDFINKIKKVVKNHDWNAYIGLCSQEHYKSQMNLKFPKENGTYEHMSKTNYIIESMNLNMVNNSIYDYIKEKNLNFNALEIIEDIKIFSIQKNGSDVILKGKIVLKNSKELNIEIDLIYDTEHGYRIAGAVG